MADEVTKHAPRAALITGAGRRIGATIALALAPRALIAVVLTKNHSREDAERLAQAITGAGARASVVLADLADETVACGPFLLGGCIWPAHSFGQ